MEMRFRIFRILGVSVIVTAGVGVPHDQWLSSEPHHLHPVSAAQQPTTLDVERYGEDFEDGVADYWKLGSGFEIRGAQGQRRLHAETPSESFFLFGEYWRDYVFKTRVRLLSREGEVVLGYRVNDASAHSGGGPAVESGPGPERYRIAFGRRAVRVERSRPGAIKELAAVPATHDLKRWYSLKISGRGPVIKVWVDGVRRIVVKDPQPVRWGSISLGTSLGSRAQLDDITVNARLPFAHTWSATDGPEGLSHVMTIVTDPSRPGVAYAGTIHNGVLKTSDGGVTWEQFTDRHGLGSTKVRDMAIADSDTNVVYLVHAERNNGARSTDAGRHWRDLGQSPSLHTIVVDPTDSDTVYVGSSGTGSGIYRSVDGGKTWSQLSIDSGSVFDIAIASQDRSLIYAATDHGVFKSEDAGTSWSRVSSGITVSGSGDVPVQALLLDPTDPNVVYARAFDQGPLFKTVDGGGTWRQINDHVSAIAIAPSNPQYLYAARAGSTITTSPCCPDVWQSTDGGESWLKKGASAPVGRQLTTIAVDPADPLKLYLGGIEAVALSRDGGATFELPQTRFAGPFATALATSPADTDTVYAGHGDGHVSMTADGGLSWRNLVTLGSGGESSVVSALAVHPLNPDLVFGANLEGVFKSTDGGNSFASSSSGLTGPGIVSLAIDPTNIQKLFAGSGSHRPYAVFEGAGMFRSLDGGGSWTKVPGVPDGPVPAIVVDPVNPQFVYASVMGHGIYKSSDGGDTWQPSGSGITNPYIYVLTIDPTNPSTLYAGTLEYYGNPQYSPQYQSAGGGVYKSEDGGVSWRLILRMNMVETIAVDPSNSQNIYVGGHVETIWYSPNGGETWQLANQGTVRKGTHLYMFALAFAADGSVLYMSNCGRGVFRNQLDEPEGYVTELQGMSLRAGPHAKHH